MYKDKYISTNLKNFTSFLLLYDFTIYTLIFLISIVAFIDGFLIEKIGFKRFETIYYSSILILILLRLIFVKIKTLLLIYLFLLLSTIVISIIVNGIEVERLISDFRYFLRSYAIGGLTFYFFYTTKSFNKKTIFKYFKFQWFIISALIFIHFLFGFGGVTSPNTGELKPIYSSFFKEGNVIAFVYITSWFFIFINQKSIIKNIIFFIITFITTILISSKAATGSLILLTLFYFISYLKKKSKLLLIITNTVFFLTIIIVPLIFNKILEFILKILIIIMPDSEIILHRLKSWDIITILLSTRDLRINNFLQDIPNYNFFEILFGIGMNRVLQENKLIESDFFDIWQGFGLIGLILFYLPLILAFIYLKTNKELYNNYYNDYLFSVGFFYILVLFSTLTGHILVTPTGMILTGLVFGYILKNKEQTNENITNK